MAGQHKSFPIGSFEWNALEQRKDRGEVTSPIIVGFEGASRGLHFDGIETVYMLGLPRKPEVYLHLAGRVGRLGQKNGKVVSVVPKRSAKVLEAWSGQIGPDVRFEREPIKRNLSAPIPLDVLGPRPPKRNKKRLPRRVARNVQHPLPQLPQGEDYVAVP